MMAWKEVPIEVWAHIFRLTTAPPEHDVEAYAEQCYASTQPASQFIINDHLIDFSQVCRLFRGILLADTRVWAQIDVRIIPELPIEFGDESIEAPSASLVQKFLIFLRHSADAHLSMVIPIGKSFPISESPLLAHALFHSARLEELTLIFEEYPHHELVPLLMAPLINLKELRHLGIHNLDELPKRDAPFNAPSAAPGIRTPALRSLQIQCVQAIEDYPLSWSRVTHLHMRHLSASFFNLRLSAMAATLTVLEICGPFRLGGKHYDLTEGIGFPYLTTFRTDHPELLRIIYVPALQNLHLLSNWHDTSSKLVELLEQGNNRHLVGTLTRLKWFLSVEEDHPTHDQQLVDAIPNIPSIHYDLAHPRFGAKLLEYLATLPGPSRRNEIHISIRSSPLLYYTCYRYRVNDLVLRGRNTTIPEDENLMLTLAMAMVGNATKVLATAGIRRIHLSTLCPLEDGAACALREGFSAETKALIKNGSLFAFTGAPSPCPS
jgi:hypothetical protein